MTNKKKWVVRIPDKKYKKLKKAAEIENMSISTAAEIAVESFAESILYGYDNIMQKIKKQPLLRFKDRIDMFSEMFRFADPETKKAVVSILERGRVSFHECSFEEFEKYIEKINKNDYSHVVPILRINVNKKPTEKVKNKINHFFDLGKKINTKTNSQMLLDKSFEEDDSTQLKIIIFTLEKEEKSKEGSDKET
ncbi:MAG: hypothetical protein ACOCRX_07325 [Candidatus Woesearchaeota archaeon]